MSQSLLCMDCYRGECRDPREGSYKVLDATPFERAEYQRITRGRATQPTVRQRTIFVNGEPQPVMSLAFYNCDLCFAEIRPGDECVAQTVWLDGQQEPGFWEGEYFANPVRQAPDGKTE